MKILTVYLILLLAALTQPGIASDKIIATYGKNQPITREQILWHSSLADTGLAEIIDTYTTETNPKVREKYVSNIKDNCVQYLFNNQWGKAAVAKGYLKRKEYQGNYHYNQQLYLVQLWTQKTQQQPLELSPEDIYSYFSTHYDEYVKENEWKISSIYLRYKADHSNTTTQFERISTFRYSIETGASFKDIARNYSESENAITSGFVGILKESKLKNPLKDVILKLRKGDLSPIVDLGNGYHLFYCEEFKPGASFDIIEQFSKISTNAAKSPGEILIRKATSQLWKTNQVQYYIERITVDAPDTTVVALVNQQPIYLSACKGIVSSIVSGNTEQKLKVVMELVRFELISQDAVRKNMLSTQDKWNLEYLGYFLTAQAYYLEKIKRDCKTTPQETKLFYKQNASQFMTSTSKNTYLLEFTYGTVSALYPNRQEAYSVATDYYHMRMSKSLHEGDIVANPTQYSLNNLGYIENPDNSIIPLAWNSLPANSISQPLERPGVILQVGVKDIILPRTKTYEQVKEPISIYLINIKAHQLLNTEIQKLYKMVSIQ